MRRRDKKPGRALALFAGVGGLLVLGVASRLPGEAERGGPPSEGAGFALRAQEFGALVTGLSGDPAREFFGDNLVSNERSSGDVGALLERRARQGGAYVGVGPEQNFTYIAWCRPALAFIIDVRRENALLHLMYKAIFSEAEDRVHFLALLLARPYEPTTGGSRRRDVSFRALRDAVLKSAKSTRLRDAHRARWVEKIEQEYHVPLSPHDRAALARIQDAFFEHQLDLRFMQGEGPGARGSSDPTLGELFEGDPRGVGRGSFLDNESDFEFVRTLESEHRIVPVVGDFAGPLVLRRIGDEMRGRHLRLSAFYASNVEQYLFEPLRWRQWVHNVRSLPTDASSLFIRSYIDQGRPHPLDRTAQRGVTVLQRADAFFEAALRYRDLYQVTTEGVLRD